ncbi:MAG: hypothetical protein ABGY41_09975 [Candidatus Poribacteria bacterium]
MPTGNANIAIPSNETIIANTWPQTVIGAMSPHPTVVSVDMPHHIAAGMLVKTSG